MKKQLILLSLLGFTMIHTSCKKKEEKNQEKKTIYCLNEEFKKQVQISELQEQQITETLSLTGNISYNEDDVISFRSLLEGIVEQVQFNLGDYVQKGQVLAVIKSSDITNLNQERQSIMNQLAVLRQKVKSTEALLEDGMASQRELEEVQMELATLQSSSQTINDVLNLYNATPQKGVFQIKAPKNGYIVEKNMTSGMNINQDQEPLFSISNLNQIWVMVNIYANHLQYIETGAEVMVKTLAYPDLVFSGKIQNISNVFDNEERVLKARVVLENKDLRLKPGMSADIIINKPSHSDAAIAIPHAAIVFNNNKKHVVIYRSDCDLSIREVQPIAENDQYIYVRENFSEGEKVITENELLIFDELNQ